MKRIDWWFWIKLACAGFILPPFWVVLVAAVVDEVKERRKISRADEAR